MTPTCSPKTDRMLRNVPTRRRDGWYDRRKVYIYQIRSGITGEIRYVGQTIHPKERFKNHLKRCVLKRTRTYCGKWLRSEIAKGAKPIFEIIETCRGTESGNNREQFWINKRIEEGCKLTNTTAGGFVFPVSAAARAALKRVIRGDEWRSKISAGKMGKKPSPESIAKANRTKAETPPLIKAIRAAHASKVMKALWHSDCEQGQNLRAGRTKLIGRVVPETERARRTAKLFASDKYWATRTGMLGKKHTPETIRKISESQIGKTVSDETRRKLSEAHSRLTKKLTPGERKFRSERMVSAIRGKPMPEQQRKRIGDAHRGRKLSPECAERLRQYRFAALGTKRTPEQKKRCSASASRRWEKASEATRTETMLLCGRCKLMKPDAEFGKSGQAKYRRFRQYHCKQCQAEKHQERIAKKRMALTQA